MSELFSIYMFSYQGQKDQRQWTKGEVILLLVSRQEQFYSILTAHSYPQGMILLLFSLVSLGVCFVCLFGF